MIIFTGVAMNKNFKDVSAPCPAKLIKVLGKRKDFKKSMRGVSSCRCWVKVETATRHDLWNEIDIDDPKHFELFYNAGLLGPDTVNIIIKSKDSASSPNAFATPPTENDMNAHNYQVAPSLTNVSPENRPPEPSQTIVTDKPPVNLIDPLTQRPIDEDDDDVVHIEIYEKGTVNLHVLAVSLRYLKGFLKYELGKGTNPFAIELKGVLCRDEQERDLVFTAPVWTKSILLHSKSLRKSFFQHTSSLARQSELERLQGTMPELWTKIMYWIADMENFSSNKDARLRLNLHPDLDAGAPMYFNNCYFTTEEALYLLNQVMPSGKTLQEAYADLLEQSSNSNGGAICTKSELAPFFCMAFGVPERFQDDGSFKKEYAEFQKSPKVRALTKKSKRQR